MLQFQGMIAEYERAQILERSRRGKRHRAKAGEVSVLCGAPYGYRYIRKTRDAPALYETDAAEAEVVRLAYDKYTVEGLSIGAIARLLREMGLPTRHRATRWERSVVWAMLRNPAYKGAACFNKTQVGQRQKVTRPFRLSGRAVHGEKSCSHERPRDEWIEIPVPAIVSEETFALAAERLVDNKRFAPRRTIEPSIVQGLVSCRKCGYALSRTSTRSSARKIHYYRCLGSDAWRHLGGAVCDCRPIRQDLLDQIVWREVVRLIENPALIQAELDRRLDAARAAEPTKRRQESLERELTRTRKSIERLVTAYQEDLLSLDELRRRMLELRTREQSMRAEMQAILCQAADRMSYLRLAETLTAFLQRLHTRRNRWRSPIGKRSSASSSKRSWWTMTPSRSGTRSRPTRERLQTNRAALRRKIAHCRPRLPFAFGEWCPVLANLFLHYTFDLWMARAFPHLRWCRYADDGLVHCRTEKEARAVWDALNARMTECRLELHPTKTKIVYCRDNRRKGNYENVAFDFLGYCFRPRSVKGPVSQRMFCGYTPAVSKLALNAMRSTIRNMKLRKRTQVTLDDIARELNPITRGWIAYYGRYTRSALYPLARYIDQTLAVWMKRKFKRFHHRLGHARDFLTKIARENPRLFVHWQLGASGGLA